MEVEANEVNALGAGRIPQHSEVVAVVKVVRLEYSP
jgi:hypothetical protein